jgi:hypothetical protein
MRRVWLGLFVGTLAGLTGCRAMPSPRHEAARPSGISHLIQSLPEPGETWHEAHGSPDRGRLLRRAKVTPAAVAPPDIPPRAEGDPTALATTKPGGLEAGFDALPKRDPAKATPATSLPSFDGPFRAITEADVRTMAATRSPSAYRTELENLIPISYGTAEAPAPAPCVDSFLRRARELAAAADRVRAVHDAASTFYQLAEAEGRAELMRAGVTAFDDARAEAGKPLKRVVNGRVVDIPAPDLSAFDGQRGQMLETAAQLMFLVRKLNIDLKQQAGLAGNTADRLYPTGEFGIDPAPADVAALVQDAIENRPDLQLLRLAYFELNEDTLPAIRDQMKHSVGLAAGNRIAAPCVRHKGLLPMALARFGHKTACVDPALVHELAVRKAQLFDLICEKEREAADQVRTACLYRDTAAELVGLARYRSDEAKKKVDAAKAAKTAAVLEFPLVFEWYKARADVIQAVMNWQQARVKLRAATGQP